MRAVIVVKWSKTLQDRVKTTTIDIPYLGDSALCPIAALKKMLATYPSHQDSSLFQIPQAGSHLSQMHFWQKFKMTAILGERKFFF